jgi:hypothetical protein
MFDTLSDLYINSRINKNDYQINEEYLMMDDLDLDEEELNQEEIDTSPTLLSSIVSSIGSNLKDKDFPFGIIKQHLEEEGVLDDEEIKKIVDGIKIRPI